jgi:hypothetical protein
LRGSEQQGPGRSAAAGQRRLAHAIISYKNLKTLSPPPDEGMGQSELGKQETSKNRLISLSGRTEHYPPPLMREWGGESRAKSGGQRRSMGQGITGRSHW